jgi:predicted dehydrogenase
MERAAAAAIDLARLSDYGSLQQEVIEMKKQISRKEFMQYSAAAGLGMAAMGAGKPEPAAAQNKPLRIGFVGVGDRGSYHLDASLGFENVEVPALCDIKDSYLFRAKRWVEETGRPAPRLYNRGKTDFKRLCVEEDLDLVICCTSWEWHAPVCVAAMENDKHCVSEVPIVITMDEAWQLVETHERTGYWATIGLEGLGDLTLLHMVRQGLLGDIIHAEGGYVHDLRLVKFDPEREPWRLQHSINRNGNLYPDHPMSRVMPNLDINHGDRFETLVSMSSKAVMLNRYAADYFGDKHPYATMEMKQGDYNCTLLRTVGGKVVTLNFDTNTPHPRGFYRLQGTKGVYLSDRYSGDRIYVEGQSPKEHQWESAEPYTEQYQHPLLKNFKYEPRKIRGHGSSSSGMILRWLRLLEALQNNKMPDWDVYDSVTSSAISPLSEMSVANRSNQVEFPDFTKGEWQNRAPIMLL